MSEKRGKRLTLSEFESLVKEIKGDCDKCKMDCRDRLTWLDSLVRAFEHRLYQLDQKAATLDDLIVRLEAVYQLNMRVLNIIKAPSQKVGTNERNFVDRFTQ